ncbi:arf-GAP with Rho-GAP domain, ANK repeat and PH domain-containing protein 2 [Bicyclus anynana]|uniref:Arf-GAP with Rho-GAP domain, ANK repeat and PH domain-containing protein 2 n=1 Tax=Bicyclus anynana TaxID=110368 RepID=A0ABM3M512_BICAN|nr:arf-GAP with Rho-GAP domain, ANK repeat and PH domain-containing protein 2 [Bicyclus anynana]
MLISNQFPMDTPPVPKPRSTFLPQNEALKVPVPLPRSKAPTNNEKVTASDVLRSITSVSKQITEDVAQKVSSSAKSANDKIEKSISDSSRFAKDTLEKTIMTSRSVRDTVTKSVIQGTKSASIKLRISKKSENPAENDSQRPVSMPVVDVSLFDNIQFHSPLLEQKKYGKDEHQLERLPALQLNTTQLDDVSLFSSNSESNTDTASNFSFDSRENDPTDLSLTLDNVSTYDTVNPSRVNSIVSLRSAPEVPERRKKRMSDTVVMRQNSLYENWTLPHSSSNIGADANPRPSKSTIYEFDPLNNNNTFTNKKYEGVSNELILLESFLIGDTYGTIISNADNGSDEYDFTETEYFNPPTPPERSDSLCPNDTSPVCTPEETGVENSEINQERASWYVDNDTASSSDQNKMQSTMMQKFSNILKLDSVRNRSNKQINKKSEVIERPPVNNLPVSYYSGMMNKVVSGVVEDLFKNSQSRFCVLSDQKLMCYSDPTNLVLKEAYMLENVHSVQLVLPLSSSTTTNSYCFEVTVSTGIRNTPRKVLFSCASASERRNWAQKLAEHLTNVFPTKYTTEFTRCGWCYLKEGVSGEWRGAWIMLIRRVLAYYAGDDVCTVDLRKTRCVVTQTADADTKQLCPSDGSPNLILDCPHATLYLRFPHERDLKGWKYMVKLAAHNNGAYIHHQQLTKDNIPVIVDKSLSFIYAHGSLSEGIYRRAGSTLVLSELLARFRRDAWSVQLTPGQHSEHDVAGVLKRFFRDLPEPLVPQEKHNTLVEALEIGDPTARHTAYRNVMTSLPIVALKTARKLFAHLHFLQTMSQANKMNAENLASVWAPTIMPTAVTSQTLQTAWSVKEHHVVRDLIVNYEAVWEPTEAELRREAAIRRVLVRVLSNTATTAPKAAGDLRAWIYVHDRNTCYQVSLTPNKTSSDICIELCEKANMESHLLMLEEVICEGSMNRIVHIDEIVLDTVLRWGYWDEKDRKDNYLIVKGNKILHDLEALKSTTTVCNELRLANETTKAFKLHMFEFKNGKLCYFKDKQGSHKIEEWDIKKIVWYVGHEPKRNPQSQWAITFIPKNDKLKRSKDRPWFGCTIAGAVKADQLQWMAALTYAEREEILPTPRLIIT